MGFINQFPYSDFHELNLDWAIKQIKENKDQIAVLQDEISKIEVMTEEQIREMINTAINNNNVLIYAAIDASSENLKAELIEYINNKINIINRNIDNLYLYVDNQDSYYDTLAHDYANQALIDAKAYADSIVNQANIMINPLTGQYDDVRNVVNDIIYYFHTTTALTAGEYDALDLTAQDYDDYELTAYDYDFNGKTLLT